MKAGTIMLAATVGIALGALALFDRPARPAKGMVVVTAPAVAPDLTLQRSGSAQAAGAVPAALGARPPAGAAVVAQASRAPVNYAYWSGDAGVWGTPAKFSTAQ